MQLVLIGGKSAVKINEILSRNFDYLEISMYSSITDFYATANVRTITVDRIILLQDALTEGDNMSRLEAFNTYLGKHHPAVRLITLLKDKEMLELMTTIFLSPYMVHIHVEKMRPRMLNEIVEQSVDILKKKYGYTASNQGQSDILGEIIEEENPKEGKPKPKKEKKGKKGGKGKKRKGLFSLFGGKKKAPESTYNALEDGTPEQVENTEEPEEALEEQEEELEEENIEMVEEYEEQEDQEDNEDLDFSMFHDDSDIGLGVEVPKELPFAELEDGLDYDAFEEGFEEPEETPEELELEEEEEIDYPEEEEESEEPEDNLLFDKDEEYEENKFLPNLESVQLSEKKEAGLNIHADKGETRETVEEELEPRIDTEERLNKLSQLKETVFQKDLNRDTIDLNIEVNNEPSVDIIEVEDNTPFIDDIENLVKAYDQENVKVVERVVETVVEKVVEKKVPVGNRKRSYRNNIRTIIVTGDRKTGVTRTALNASAFFSKTSKTLYVDFDIHRKGSLLYLGLENIADEEDHIQNGLIFLRNQNMLSNITHTFLKGGFDCLISMYGEVPEDEQLYDAQRVLTTQRDYQTLIIDCPLENLHYLEDIILYSEILVCVESSLPSVLNTILGLSRITENEKFQSFLFNNSQFLLSDSNLKEFNENMDYISEMFSLEQEKLNWSKIKLIGNLKGLRKVLEEF